MKAVPALAGGMLAPNRSEWPVVRRERTFCVYRTEILINVFLELY